MYVSASLVQEEECLPETGAMEQRAWALLQLKKPETWGPERCSQLSVQGGPTGQDAASRFLWATRVELRHGSKVASTLP